MVEDSAVADAVGSTSADAVASVAVDALRTGAVLSSPGATAVADYVAYGELCHNASRDHFCYGHRRCCDLHAPCFVLPDCLWS